MESMPMRVLYSNKAQGFTVDQCLNVGPPATPDMCAEYCSTEQRPRPRHPHPCPLPDLNPPPPTATVTATTRWRWLNQIYWIRRRETM
jgi:hypothetical protein